MLRGTVLRQVAGSTGVRFRSTLQPLRHQLRLNVRVNTSEQEGDNVANLLGRDFKQPKLAPELEPEDSPAASPRFAEAASSDTAPARGRRQKREALLPKGDSATQSGVTYKKCKEALDAGLEAFASKQYSKAVELFSLALELPGEWVPMAGVLTPSPSKQAVMQRSSAECSVCCEWAAS